MLHPLICPFAFENFYVARSCLDQKISVVGNEMRSRGSAGIQRTGELVDLLLSSIGEEIESRGRMQWVFFPRDAPSWNE